MGWNRVLVSLLSVLVLSVGACSDQESSGAGAEEAGGEVLDASDDIVVAGDPDEGIDGVSAYRIASHDHTGLQVDYPVRPAPGGPHSQMWVNCGFHDVPFDDEDLVHDLEHGAVWLAYSPDLTDAEVEVIRELAVDHKVVAAPYADLAPGEAVVATAWARQLRLDSIDDERLEQFVARYEDGSQAPEAGVTCTGSPLG
ncbi:MAG: DUF3105 domain-containing protein [Acidimicrobiales bacterium]